MKRVGLLLAALLILSSPASAQTKPNIFSKALKQVVLDPTTYAPAIVFYDSDIRDWKNSQPLFKLGLVEMNPRFTISGQVRDIPISYEAGRKIIIADTFFVGGESFVHNYTERLLENQLKKQNLQHPRLIKTIGWTERIAFAVWLAQYQAGPHYRQISLNERMYREAVR